MEAERKVQILQIAYIGVLVDNIMQLDKENILEKVIERKRTEQLAIGKTRASQFGIKTPHEVFTRLSEIFGCVKWEIILQDNGFVAEAAGCMLCSMSKKAGSPSPCHLYCLDPMEGMIKGINPDIRYNVKETLWDGRKCIVEVKNTG